MAKLNELDEKTDAEFRLELDTLFEKFEIDGYVIIDEDEDDNDEVEPGSEMRKRNKRCWKRINGRLRRVNC